jgi:hypothetical protein
MNTFDKLTFKILLATTIHEKENGYVANFFFISITHMKAQFI